MSANLNTLQLELLRRLGAKVAGLADQVHDLTHRVTTLEQQLAALTATEAIHHAGTTVRLDRIVRRLDRIDPPGAG
jgi:hypothetical protein